MEEWNLCLTLAISSWHSQCWGIDCRLDALRKAGLCHAVFCSTLCTLVCIIVVVVVISWSVVQASRCQTASWPKTNKHFISLSPPKIQLRTVPEMCCQAGRPVCMRERLWRQNTDVLSLLCLVASTVCHVCAPVHGTGWMYGFRCFMWGRQAEFWASPL